MLVSHSFGTIVCYDVLIRQPRRHQQRADQRQEQESAAADRHLGHHGLPARLGPGRPEPPPPLAPAGRRPDRRAESRSGEGRQAHAEMARRREEAAAAVRTKCAPSTVASCSSASNNFCRRAWTAGTTSTILTIRSPTRRWSRGWVGAGHRRRHVPLGGRAARLRRLHRQRLPLDRLPARRSGGRQRPRLRGVRPACPAVRDFWIRWDPGSAAPPARGCRRRAAGACG